jgi:2'-5' RNA ligase
MRLFVGLPVPEAARLALAAAIRDRPALAAALALPTLRRHPALDWHLTLAFLGQATPEQARACLPALAAAPLGPAYTIALGGCGAFPDPAGADVLWLGVGAGREATAALAAAVARALAPLGFPPDPRPFTPHLTLARANTAHDLRALVAGTTPVAVPWSVDALALFESRTPERPGDPRYHVLATHPLR